MRRSNLVIALFLYAIAFLFVGAIVAQADTTSLLKEANALKRLEVRAPLQNAPVPPRPSFGSMLLPGAKDMDADMKKAPEIHICDMRRGLLILRLRAQARVFIVWFCAHPAHKGQTAQRTLLGGVGVLRVFGVNPKGRAIVTPGFGAVVGSILFVPRPTFVAQAAK